MAPLRAFILLASVLDVPGVAPTVRRLTAAPRVESGVIDGVPTEIVRPGGKGPWPVFVFVNGAHPERRREAMVRRLTDGLARAGFLVCAPEPTGLAEREITPATLTALNAAVRSIVDWPEVRGGRAALLGASTGASLALLIAADPLFAGRISVVVAATPYADLARIVRLSTTAEPGADTAMSELVRSTVRRSLAACLPAGRHRDALRAALRRMEESDVQTPETLEALEAELDDGCRALVRLLVGGADQPFADLYAALPAEVRDAVVQLSPIVVASHVHAPVELVVPPRDEHFPPDEATALASALPRVRLTVTPTLDHTRPSLSTSNATSLAAFAGFVARGLGAASRE